METQKYSGKKKNSRKFHKETLNLLCPGSVYTAFTLCLQLFTQHLHCIRHYKHRRQWHPTPVLLPGKSHGRRSLVGWSPWGCKESDMTEQLHFHFSLPCLGAGNGHPLSVLAWRIPGTGEPGGLPSMGSHRVGHDWSNLAARYSIYSLPNFVTLGRWEFCIPNKTLFFEKFLVWKSFIYFLDYCGCSNFPSFYFRLMVQ